MAKRTRTMALAVFTLLAAATVAAADEPNYESPPVHPVEISPDGTRLYVAHLADHRLVVYDLSRFQPVKADEVMVGLEPVTVRAPDATTVWVVNHVSNSISIVDVTSGHVVRTIHPGAEPTDVVFAAGKAFVCLSQDDAVRVYDLGNVNAAPTTIPLEMSVPWSLAVSLDGSTVYVASLDSGNRTTVVPFETVEAMGGPPPPNPPMDISLPPPPRVGLIVRHDGTKWVDEVGGNWDAGVPYTIPDNDVIGIDTSTLVVNGTYHGVGTSLLSIVVSPSSGDLYVTNLEAFNHIRFEPNLQGRFVQSRLSRIAVGSGVVTPYHINAHIDYNIPGGSAGERTLSLSMPLDIAISSVGDAIYVAAFGSGKIGVMDTGGNVTRRITVGDGPAGIGLDEARNRLYVYNRISSTLSIVDLGDDSVLEMSLGFDPTPSSLREGRKLFYDGENSSAHGDLSCASCHLFGGMDNIAWDLGNPTGSMEPVEGNPLLPDFHPMKGPMTTQSLKGLTDTGPFHWRGDNPNLVDFNPAFVNLMGRPEPLSTVDFQLFEDFVFSLRYPANPYRLLDGSLPSSIGGSDPVNGENLYLTGNLVGGLQCVTCHALPTGENGTIIPGQLLQEDEAKVVPQLRNLYEKTRFDDQAASTVRGFGFTHDGAVDDLFTFLQFPAFTFASDDDRRDVEAFLLAFDTGTPPAIGAQLTIDGPMASAASARLDTLTGEADLGRIGLIAKALVSGMPRGWTYVGGGTWTPDKVGEPDITQAALLSLAAPGAELTFTGVGSGTEGRLGIDRDLDGFRDGDELDAGSDPGDPVSTPGSPATGIPEIARRPPSALWVVGPNPTSAVSKLEFRVGLDGPARLDVYDVRGRLVRRLVADSSRRQGTYFETWDLRNQHGASVSSGIYFARLRTLDGVRVQRIAVIR